MRSAFSVVMPPATACSEYSPPSARSIRLSERAIIVDVRCTMVTSAPFSHRSAQISCAELFDPITTARLPRHASPPGCLLEWVLLAGEAFGARIGRHVRQARHAGRQHELLRTQGDRAPLAFDGDLPLLGLFVVVRRGADCGVPAGQLHRLLVASSQSGDLVLRREHRPRCPGNGRYGMWSYQTGSCRQSDL